MSIWNINQSHFHHKTSKLQLKVLEQWKWKSHKMTPEILHGLRWLSINIKMQQEHLINLV